VAAKKSAEMFSYHFSVLLRLARLLTADGDAAIAKAALGAINRFLNNVSGLNLVCVEASLKGCIAFLGHTAAQIQRTGPSEKLLCRALHVLTHNMDKLHLVDMLAQNLAALCFALPIEVHEPRMHTCIHDTLHALLTITATAIIHAHTHTHTDVREDPRADEPAPSAPGGRGFRFGCAPRLG
jgi:hypothetical protein